jgi:hypothetical protein
MRGQRVRPRQPVCLSSCAGMDAEPWAVRTPREHRGPSVVPDRRHARSPFVWFNPSRSQRRAGLLAVASQSVHPVCRQRCRYDLGAGHYSRRDSAMCCPRPSPVRLCMVGGLPVSPTLGAAQPRPLCLVCPLG